MRPVSAWHVALLILGIVLLLKDEVLHGLVLLVDAAQQVEGLRLLIVRHCRNYRSTLEPSEGFDIVEAFGLLLTGAAVGLIVRRATTSTAERE